MKTAASKTIGHRTVNGTQFPIEHVIKKDGRKWLLLASLCNGVPKDASYYDTLAEAKEVAGIED